MCSSLKIPWSKIRTGSSPVSGTSKKERSRPVSLLFSVTTCQASSRRKQTGPRHGSFLNHAAGRIQANISAFLPRSPAAKQLCTFYFYQMCNFCTFRFCKMCNFCTFAGKSHSFLNIKLLSMFAITYELLFLDGTKQIVSSALFTYFSKSVALADFGPLNIVLSESNVET